MRCELFYWKDNTENEIDCLFQWKNSLHAIEIKSAKTFHENFLKNLFLLHKIYHGKLKRYLVYGGSLPQKRNDILVLPWQDIHEVIV